jgi:hypothetical protein
MRKLRLVSIRIFGLVTRSAGSRPAVSAHYAGELSENHFHYQFGTGCLQTATTESRTKLVAGHLSRWDHA